MRSSTIADKLGLKPMQLECFAGFIFINLDDRPALSLVEFLGGIAPLLAATTLAPFTCRAELSAEVPADWKAGLDPQYEGYHVSTVHALTIKEMTASPDRQFGEFYRTAFAGPHAVGWSRGNTGWRPRADRFVQSFAMGSLGTISARLQREGYPSEHTPASLTIFPNLMLHPAAGGWFTQHWPLSAGRHRWTAHYYYPEPADMSERLGLAQATTFARDSGMEDFIVIERQQMGLASGAIDKIYYGEGEILPRHRAAVIQGALDAARQPKRDAA